MSKWGKAAFIVGVLLLVFLPLLVASKYIAIGALRGYFINSVVNVTGLNHYLVSGLTTLLIVPLLIGLSLLFSFKKRKRTLGKGILVILIASYNLALYFLTKDLYFNFGDGKPLKWYSLTAEGCRFFGSPGVDPVYGVELAPVTFDIISYCRLLKTGEFTPVNPSDANWFDPITRHPRLWYYRFPDGKLDFYNKPGYHPRTGEPLEPVTKEIYFEWQQSTASDVSIESPTEQPTPAGAGKRAVQEVPEVAEQAPQQIDPRKQRISLLRALINASPSIRSDVPNVAIYIHSIQKQNGQSPTAMLYSLLQSSRVNLVPDLLRQKDFYEHGLFQDIYRGDADLLRQSHALAHVDYLVLGTLDYSYRRGGGLDPDLVSCNLNLSYKIFGHNASVVDTKTIRVSGPGFSEDAALQRALEILSERHSEEIFRIMN